MQFATAEQYRAVYDTKAADERLDAFLAKASRRMAAAMDAEGVGYDEPTEDFAAVLSDVCCDVTHRALGEDGATGTTLPFGATQYSQGAGDYTESYTLSNPYGDMFLTKAERELLGLGRQVVGSVTPLVGDEDRERE
jgi:hypothetical protein